MLKPTVKVTFSDDFNLPNIPKYITRPDGTKIHIKNLPEKALQVIGKEWAKQLIEKAEEERHHDTLPLPLGEEWSGEHIHKGEQSNVNTD